MVDYKKQTNKVLKHQNDISDWLHELPEFNNILKDKGYHITASTLFGNEICFYKGNKTGIVIKLYPDQNPLTWDYLQRLSDENCDDEDIMNNHTLFKAIVEIDTIHKTNQPKFSINRWVESQHVYSISIPFNMSQESLIDYIEEIINEIETANEFRFLGNV